MTKYEEMCKYYTSPHEMRTEVNDVDENGIHFMCHDSNGNACHLTITSKFARELALDLLDAADEMDKLYMVTKELTK